jgi:diguanylate cyclase (GGDEF)-like protein/PAS domain S-box-containing protein
VPSFGASTRGPREDRRDLVRRGRPDEDQPDVGAPPATVAIPTATGPGDTTPSPLGFRVLLGAGLVVVGLITWLGATDSETGVRVVRALQSAAAVLFTVLALRRSRREPGGGWLPLAVFGAVWSANRVGALLHGDPVPQGSMSGPLHWLWVVGVPAAFAGLYQQCFGRLPRRNRWRVLSDALVVAASWSFVAWSVMRWAGGTGTWRSAMVVPLLEVLAASLVVTASVHQPRRRTLRWAAVTMVAVVVGDGTVTHQLATGMAVGDVVLFAGFAVSGLSVVRFVTVPDEAGGEASLTSPRRRLLSLPMVLVVVVGVLDATDLPARDRPGALLLLAIVGAAVVNYQLVFGEIAETVGRLEESEAQFRTVFEHAPVAIVLSDVVGSIIRANPAVAELTGRPIEELCGADSSPLVDPEDRGARSVAVAEVVSGARDHAELDVRVLRPDGGERWAHTTVARLPGGGPPRLVSVSQDVTDRRRSDERLRYLARHDPLTGLLNRSAFEARVAVDTRGGTEQRPSAVVIVDLDQFKVVNDSLGHDYGDRLLVACARRLQRAVGDAGFVARFGADEFGVLLAPAPGSVQRAQVDELARTISREVDIGEGEHSFPTASVGAVLWHPGATAVELLSAADVAMHRAKARGRNRVEWFSAVDRQQVAATHRLVQQLHRAVDRREFVVHFQPFVDAASGATIGAEALVRWAHPDRGLLPPGAFLPVAESSGLLVQIGEQVLATAAAHAARWNAAAHPDQPLAVSVNVSAQQLLDRSFPATVARILHDTGLDAGRLWLELTETTLMSEAAVIGEALGSLRGMGVRMAVDDFGTGYSSLTYLKRFPVESLKVDRSFVSGLGIDLEDTAIVGALVDLGHRLGLRVVAEGVETELQRDVLGELGCDVLQGFLLARPLPAPELEQRLAAEVAARRR